MSISAVFPSAQHLLLSVQHEVNQFESAADRSPALAQSISGHLDALQRQLTDMESLVALEGARREMWRSRVRGMSEEVGQLSATFTRVQQSLLRKAREEDIRSQLMGGARRRVDTNVSRTQARTASTARRGSTTVPSLPLSLAPAHLPLLPVRPVSGDRRAES